MTELPDLTEVVPEGSITLPIHGVKYTFKWMSSALGYVLTKAASRGLPDVAMLPDDRNAAEYRDLLGEHYDALGPVDGTVKLSHPEFQHLANTLVTWNIFGRAAAAQVWTRSPKQWAPADDASSAGAPARTASTSGTSTKTARRSQPKRKRRR